MIFGPFLCSTTFTITNDLRCRGYSSSSSTARKRKRQNSNFLFLLFIDHRFPRFGRKYYALISELPCRSPAVSLNTSGIARSFSISIAAVLPYREYEQVSALFLYDPAILPRAEKRFLIQFFFPLCSVARLTEQRIAVILSPESLIAWPESCTTGHALSI